MTKIDTYSPGAGLTIRQRLSFRRFLIKLLIGTVVAIALISILKRVTPAVIDPGIVMQLQTDLIEHENVTRKFGLVQNVEVIEAGSRRTFDLTNTKSTGKYVFLIVGSDRKGRVAVEWAHLRGEPSVQILSVEEIR